MYVLIKDSLQFFWSVLSCFCCRCFDALHALISGCSPAQAVSVPGDPRHSFIFSNTQTTFFFSPRDIYSKESIGIMFLFDFFASVTLGLNDLSPHDNLFSSQENLTVKQPRSCRASGVVVGVGRIDFLSNRKGSSSF